MWDMARFYAEYQSNEILQPLVAEISWSKHIVILTKCKETQQRQFYILATKKYGWTKDVLIHKIELKTYENFPLGQSNFDTTLTESSTQSSSEEGHRKRTWLNSGHAPFLFKSNIRVRTDLGLMRMAYVWSPNRWLAKSDGSFDKKQAVVLWKMTRHFMENNTLFLELLLVIWEWGT